MSNSENDIDKHKTLSNDQKINNFIRVYGDSMPHSVRKLIKSMNKEAKQ